MLRKYKKIFLTFEEKLEEYLKLTEVNDYKILERDSNYLFSDSTKMSSFWNNFRKNIYDEIIDGKKSKYYQDKYPKCCENIIKKFHKITLTFEEKLEEILEILCTNSYNIFEFESNKLFSDGTKMIYFWNKYKRKIYDEYINGEKSKYYQDKYPGCREIMESLYVSKLSFETKLEEFLKVFQDNGYSVIKYDSAEVFIDGTRMTNFWYNQKNKIYDVITNQKYYQDNYPIALKMIEKIYNKNLSFEERVIEFLEAIIEDDYEIFKYNTTQVFSDGTKVAGFWESYSFKIYNLINSNNRDNEYYKNYRYSCDRINIEIYNHLIKHKKFEEAKQIFNDESEYEKILGMKDKKVNIKC